MLRHPFAVRSPKPNTEFGVHNGRLVLYHEEDRGVDYWEQYWNEEKRARLTSTARSGDLGELEAPVLRYVTKDQRVLEAGCGPGHLVVALQKRGYDAVGLDYEARVVRFAKECLPETDVREGNVLSLSFDDGEIGCYLSVGVVEHFIDGPQAALVEARRVLHPGGVALISVPYLNPSRQAHLARLSRCPPAPSRLHFHQYYFDVADFTSELNRAGFEVVDLHPYAAEAFLVREHPFVSWFWRSPLCRERMKAALRRAMRSPSGNTGMRYAHMMMYVCTPAR